MLEKKLKANADDI